MRNCDQKQLARRAASALEDATHTCTAALRPGTAVVVKRSAGLDCVSVSPLGSVVIPGSASLSPPKTAGRHEQCSPRGFGGAAPKLRLLIFLHVGDVVVLGHGLHTRLSGKATDVRHACGTNPRSMSLISMFLWSRVFSRRGNRVLSDSRESCAWSCGALSRPLRRGPSVGHLELLGS